MADRDDHEKTNLDDGVAERDEQSHRCQHCYRVYAGMICGFEMKCDRCLRYGCEACLPLMVQETGSYVYVCMNCHLEMEAKRFEENDDHREFLEEGEDGNLEDLPPELVEEEEEELVDVLQQQSDSDDEQLYIPTNYENLLRAAGVEKRSMPLPWEVGWLSTIMGAQASDHFVPMPGIVPMTNQPDHTIVEPLPMPPPTVLKNAIFKKRRVEFVKEIKQERQAAIRMCLAVLQTVPGSSVLSRQIDQLPEEQAMQVVADTLEDKATGTIKSRSYSLAQFVRWKAIGGKGPAFPISEADVYEYVSYLRHVGAPATRATRFRQALAFAKYVLGVNMDEETLSSRRVAGAALASFKNKRLLKQRSPLTVRQLSLMEQAVVMSSDKQEVVFLGHCLFATHVRCRFSDMMNVTVEPEIDGPYVEAATHKHKTSNVAGRRNKWLPLAGLSTGVSGVNWAETWLRARADCNLCAGEGKPFLPAPLSDGTWGVGKLSLGEATLWLREVLIRAGIDPAELGDLGTHSLKATLLSWLAKAGLDHESRRLLGGHVSKVDGSMMAYSRDGLAGPLLKLERLVDQVRLGLFDPDAHRAGRWKEDEQEQVVEVSDDGFLLPTPKNVPRPARNAQEQDDVVSSSSGSEERDESSGEEAFDKASNVVVGLGINSGETEHVWKRRAAARDVDPSSAWRHVVRLTYHLGSFSDCGKLACGREITDRFSKCIEMPSFLWPRCTGCFGNEPVAQIEDA